MHVDINGGNVGYLLWEVHNQASIMQHCLLTGWLATDICVYSLDLSQHRSALFVHNARATKFKVAVHTCMHAN